MKDYSRILKNFLSLVLLQGTNFIIPIVIIPYLIKTLGVDKFGIVSLAQTTMNYLFVLVDYGFSLSAVKDIALNKEDSTYLNRVYSEVMITKIILGIVGFLLLLIPISIYPKFIENWQLLLLSYTMVLGQILLPTWFYQGIDAMKYTTITNLIAKIIFTIAIFIFIKEPTHDLWVNALLGFGNCFAGIASIIFLSYYYHINLSVIVGLKGVKSQLVNGWYYLLSNLSVSIYMNSNIVILGLFANDHLLGLYSIAEKIALLIRQALVVFSQAVYTHICQIVEENSVVKMKHFMRKIFSPFLLLVCLGCLILFVCCGIIPDYLKMSESDAHYMVLLIRILSVVPIIVCLNIPFYQVLLTYNKAKEGSYLLSIGAVVSLVVNLLLASHFSAIGTASTIVIVELLLTTAIFWTVQKSSTIIKIM
jgi:PST family polysaccharide transporter